MTIESDTTPASPFGGRTTRLMAREDYPNMAGMKTIGEDYVLTLKATVT